MSAKKENRGGKRKGAGRPKVNYKTTTISFRVRVEWEEEIKKTIKAKILELTKIERNGEMSPLKDDSLKKNVLYRY